MTTSIASAQGIALSGSAEMGVIGGSEIDTQFHTDIDITFRMSGEADNGLTFGATIDLDEEGGFGNTNGGPEGVFVAFGGFRLDMGDTDGALDWAVGELDFGGAINDDHTGHAGFSGNGGVGRATALVGRVGNAVGAANDVASIATTIAAVNASAGGDTIEFDQNLIDLSSAAADLAPLTVVGVPPLPGELTEAVEAEAAVLDITGAVVTPAVDAADATYTTDGAVSDTAFLGYAEASAAAAQAAFIDTAGALVQATSGIGLDGMYDGQVARGTYTAGAFSVAASLEVADDRQGIAGYDPAGAIVGIGARYTMDGLTFGVGYQTLKMSGVGANDDITASAMAASVSYNMDAITVAMNYGKNSYDFSGIGLDVTHVGVGAEYSMNALTLAANYGQYTHDFDGLDSLRNSGFGVSATYDMGGGLVAQLGYGASNFDSDLNLDNTNSWSLGLAMSF